MWGRVHREGCGVGCTERGVGKGAQKEVWGRVHREGCGVGCTERDVG